MLRWREGIGGGMQDVSSCQDHLEHRIVREPDDSLNALYQGIQSIAMPKKIRL